MRGAEPKYARIGIFDHTGGSLGGAQLVAGSLAATLSHSYDVELISDSREFTLEKLASAFNLDLQGVRERIFSGVWTYGFEIPGEQSLRQQFRTSRALTAPYDLFIYCGHRVPPFCYGRKGLVYCHFPKTGSPANELLMSPRWTHRRFWDRIVRRVAYEALWRFRMRRYEAVLTNSCFSAEWMTRRWRLHAEVVYPPVDLTVPAVRKQNLIVTIGRFDACTLRNKEQLAQVQAFRAFLRKAPGEWKLLLIGSCYSAAEEEYLRTVRQAAEGLPVSFLVNVDRDVISSILARAKLFWHTQGLSNDDTEKPWEAEHFGIATVEAMRAGCVPIVIASGGQKEIVQHGVTGFLCEDTTGLVDYTLAVIQSSHLFHMLSEGARRRSMDFTRDAFADRIIRIVRGLVPCGQKIRDFGSNRAGCYSTADDSKYALQDRRTP